MIKKILILGGSTEGFSLAESLSKLAALKPNGQSIEFITSFAGRTSLPRKPMGPYRTSGFGGVTGLANFLKSEKIDLIMDATHPFAEIISDNAFNAAAIASIPIIHIWRPSWQPGSCDNWQDVNSVNDAVDMINVEESPVFLTIGRMELKQFTRRTDINFLARTIELDHNDPFDWPENFKFIHAKGPFNEEAERNVILDNKIKLLVTKNSGGDKSVAKLNVARNLAIKVLMIKRPPPPKGKCVETPIEAIEYLNTLQEPV